MIVVAKIGSSSVTTPAGAVDTRAIAKLCGEVATLWREGHSVVVVTSGAVTAGVSAVAARGEHRNDPTTLQALSAIGQPRLMTVYADALAHEGLLAGQVLLDPLDFANRQRYLHARDTFERLLELDVVPIVNENDAVADDEIRFGDNDRLAALVAHLLRAELLVLLTDTAGLLSADPRHDAHATLIEEVTEIDHELEQVAGGTGSSLSRGGMSSKLAAAKMAVWSGSRVVIASARREAVLSDALRGRHSVGTTFLPQHRALGARKLWIAFALPATGSIVVDDGARAALSERGKSLLPAGVVSIQGQFKPDDAVEICGTDGKMFAKGIVRLEAARSSEWVGRHSDELADDLAPEVVHRDDLVVL
jgi:glutamate 5-kinase